MALNLSRRPGRRERHLARKLDNPLFPESERQASPAALTEAQRLDHEELTEFIGVFRALVLEATKLQPNEDSEVILGLKERLEQCYEQAAGLADDQSETIGALARLLDLVNAAIRRGAAADAAAMEQLGQEQEARKLHFELLQHPLVADLLAPDSPVRQEELAATLMSSDTAEYQAALSLLDRNQRALLYQDGIELLQQCPQASVMAQERIAALGEEMNKGD